MRKVRASLLVLIGALLPATTAIAESPVTASVRGGIYDKPFMLEAGRTRFGGYADLQYRHEREEGFASESSFVAKQVNLFFFAPLHERVRFTTELEIEDGGEELKVELAVLDFDVAQPLTLRVGMLLSPIGRFNIAHDSPTNDFVDRPLVATHVIPTTLSEPGAGAFGSFAPWSGARVSYEAYLVNGFDGDVEDAFDESPLENGDGNLIDNNLFPSVVGRVGFSPLAAWQVGVSGHAGPYNVWEVEGLELDVRRDVALLAADSTLVLGPIEAHVEAAHGTIDLPEGLAALRGSRFGGVSAETMMHWGRGLISILPRSVFTVGARYGYADHDLNVAGDHRHRATLGLNFRPIEKTVFKVDYQREYAIDRIGNPLNIARFLFAGATYF